jgi:hypothetical protein
MVIKTDKITKLLLGAIALGLFFNASEIVINKVLAGDARMDVRHCMDGAKIVGFVASDGTLTAKIKTYC